MKDQRHNTRHSVSLILALVGSIAAVVLVLAPSRRATAQATASWTFTGNLNEARWSPLVTQLQNGKVLVAGGYDPDSETYPSPSSAELYDPATGTWSFTGNLNGFYSAATTLAGVYSTATTLANGKVLVVGGTGSTELYDPATGTWTNTGDPSIVFGGHREVPLPNGRLLMVGGYRTELYDPDTGTWSVTGSQHTARSGFTATVLPNGKVLIAGGSSWFDNPPHVLNSAELYDPTTGNWSFTGNLNTGRDFHAATLLSNGKALVVGGVPCLNSQCSSYFSSSELYDPLTGTWSYTGNVNTARAWDSIISSVPSVLPLPNGKVLIVGGHANAGYLNSAELYDSATGNWSDIASPNRAREAAAIAPLPNGKILVAGGETCNSVGCSIDNSAEVYDSGTGSTATPTPTLTPTPTTTATPTATPTPTPTPAGPTWTITGNLNTGRDSQTATLLPNGKVLVVGGNDSNGTLKSTELYDPTTGTWTNTSSLNTSRAFHTATLLPNGKVLAAGGFSCGPPPQTCADINSAELYDPATGTWTSTGNLNAARSGQTATLLSSGKVLVAGGFFNNSELNTAELYDPATGTWSVTGNLNLARFDHTSTLLPNGNVIVAGGANSAGSLNSAELYNPTAGTWSTTGNLNTTRQLHTATLLPNGRVLAAAGFIDFNTGAITNSAELYDPATGVWTNTGSLNRGRSLHTATLLMTGKVLVAGGFFIDGLPNITDRCELYDPATGTWSNTASLNIGRRFHTATLLLDGKVLAAGGQGFNAPNSAELYYPGPNPIDDARAFVRQHYLDFLGREPDGPGWDHWTAEITMCGDAANRAQGETEAQCIDRKRTNTSGAFYLSNEFQNSANFLIRVNWGSLGQDRAIGRKCIVGQHSALDAVCRPLYTDYISDLAKLTQGIVVNDTLDPNVINANKHNFVKEFVTRADFLAAYPNTMTAAEYVDKLSQTTGIALTAQERADLITRAQTTDGRAAVLYDLVDGTTTIDGGFLRFDTRYGKAYYDQEFNPAFVFVQYLGYLRRNPDQAGYDHWLGKLNFFGNFVDAEMVRSFLVSDEYRGRFGP